MPVSKGDHIPEATLMTMTGEGPKPLKASEYFKGRTVALFALPGAYTPTCSAKHLPGFIEKAGELKAKGVDEIACLSVNDVFVMGAWGKDQKAGDAVTLLADGNAEFTRGMGLTMDGSGFGMGERSQRYSALVRDGVIEQLNVEAPGDFRVSSAEHMLGQL
ncbi:MAG: peroxiredoxin [Maricaulaceae bacterium]|nr:peroxiredoxin [Maricaulaceae bacterium]